MFTGAVKHNIALGLTILTTYTISWHILHPTKAVALLQYDVLYCTVSLYVCYILSGFKYLCYGMKMAVDRKNMLENILYIFCMCKLLVLL